MLLTEITYILILSALVDSSNSLDS